MTLGNGSFVDVYHDVLLALDILVAVNIKIMVYVIRQMSVVALEGSTLILAAAVTASSVPCSLKV
jgi:hypothetical protein